MPHMEYIDGTKLTDARLRAHITQRELASRAGLTTETINRLERADPPRRVYSLTLRKLADALGVAESDLRGESPRDRH